MHVSLIKCDGCGDTFPDGRSATFSVMIEIWEEAKDPMETSLQRRRYYDLCPDCLRHIGKWVDAINKDFFFPEVEEWE